MKTRKAKTILSCILTFALAMGLMTTAYAASDEELAEQTAAGENLSEETTTPNTEATENPAYTEDAEMTDAAYSDWDAETQLLAADSEDLSEDVAEEDPEEDAEIQVFAATEGNQILNVEQKVQGTIGEDVAFTYHIYQITEAEETIRNMGDIIASEPGTGLDYGILTTSTGEEISSETTGTNGSFSLHVGETAQFTLEANTNWYVTQDAPEAHSLISVESDGEYAAVVDDTNGVVYYGQVEPESHIATVILTLYDYNEHVLPGATFALYRNYELYEEDLVTDENGQIIVTDLEPGEYYFEEISVDVDETGYELPGYHYSKHFIVEEELTEDVTITREMHDPATQTYNVKYAVSIYGINQDVGEDGETLGLTFGPATGASYISTYKAHDTYDEFDDPHGENFCIHWMSWEEIIEQCAEDPTVFEPCLENGCTHAVDLMLNGTLLQTDYSGKMENGDGTGFLYNSVSDSYRKWNSNTSNAGGWPASRIRATLNGMDSSTDSSVAGSDTLSASNCLLSCFPSVLQDAIVPKTVKSDTVYNNQAEENNVTTYDKLWLFSGKELYGDAESNNDVIRTYEGELYQRSTLLGITTKSYDALTNYNEFGGNTTSIRNWWLRSTITSGGSYAVYYVDKSGDWYSYTVAGTYGLAPGFCLK